MTLGHRGVTLSVIALWLGHESVETTQMYLHADARLKEQALARTAPIRGKMRRFKPREDVMTFLENRIGPAKDDLTELRALAKKRGVGHTTLARSVLEQWLERIREKHVPR